MYVYLGPADDLWTSNLHWTLGLPGPRRMQVPIPGMLGQAPIVPMFVDLASLCQKSDLSNMPENPHWVLKGFLENHVPENMVKPLHQL